VGGEYTGSIFRVEECCIYMFFQNYVSVCIALGGSKGNTFDLNSEVSGSNQDRDTDAHTGCSDSNISWFSSVPPSICRTVYETRRITVATRSKA
jgi:hypothetical protein